jgi:ribosome-binding factor A
MLRTRLLSSCDGVSSAAGAHCGKTSRSFAAVNRCATQKQKLISLRVFLHSRWALEHRGQKYHRGRLSAAIREEIETILEGELSDPRIGLASVSAVLMAQDARSARVMVTVAGDEAEAERTLEGLAAAKNYVRHELAERLRLRRPPELYFQIDRADQLESRVDELLSRAKKRKKKNAEPGP